MTRNRLVRGLVVGPETADYQYIFRFAVFFRTKNGCLPELSGQNHKPFLQYTHPNYNNF